jgi:hypothetical protein
VLFAMERSLHPCGGFHDHGGWNKHDFAWSITVGEGVIMANPPDLMGYMEKLGGHASNYVLPCNTEEKNCQLGEHVYRGEDTAIFSGLERTEDEDHAARELVSQIVYEIVLDEMDLCTRNTRTSTLARAHQRTQSRARSVQNDGRSMGAGIHGIFPLGTGTGHSSLGAHDPPNPRR